MAWKYIMFKDSTGRFFPVIFPDVMVHQEVSHGIRRAFAHLRAAAIDSAGSIDGITVDNVHGQSETLRVRSNPDRDRTVIETYRWQHGYDMRVTATVDRTVRTSVPETRRERVVQDPPRPQLSQNDRRFLRLTNQSRGTGHGDDFGRE